MENMIEVKDITKRYKSCTAVDHLTLGIREGEIFGLLGPNGAGKSTLVSMLSTILTPTDGEIRIGGMTLHNNSRKIKQMMGVVPQELALYETLNARDNLLFFGGLYGLTGNALHQRMDEVLEMIELKEKAGQAVKEYSGGMKRRLNIGIALMNRPKILILDEPTVGIDPQSRNHILETVKRLNRDWQMTVVYTSQYMEEVEFLCERIGIIDFGKLKALGTLDELKASAHVTDTLCITCGKLPDEPEKTRLRLERLSGVEKAEVNGNEVRLILSGKRADVFSIMEGLKASGLPIARFHFQQAGLEDVFLKITGKSLRE